MRRNELDESLLSSSHFVIQDKPQPILQITQDLNLERLYRKFNQSLRELKKERTRQVSRPFLCPIVFSPQSKFIIGWQVLNIILIYLYFMQIPIILAFQNHRTIDETERFFQLLNTPTIIVFMCGIIVKMNTSFYQDGLLRKDPNEIRNNYFKKTLLFDIVTILVILIYEILEATKQFEDQGLKVFVVLFYLKFFQLLSTENTMINSFDLNRRTKASLKLFLLLMKILLVCNVVACSGFYISYYLASLKDTFMPDGVTLCTFDCYWVMSVEFAGRSLYDYDEDFYIQYIYSLYWASTTMISIGYGDITPKNPSEVGFTVFIQFLSCLLYGYAINQIWSIIQELNAKKFKIHSRLNIINLYMRDKEISPELTSRVNAYLNNYYYAKNLRERQIQAEIIGQLTPSLRKQLFYQSYSVIFSHKYFKNTSVNLKENICCSVKEVGYYEAEMVFANEANKEPCLYYVKKGELCYESGLRSHTLIKNLYNSDIFGIYEFFTQLHFKCDLRAAEYSLLFYVKANDWRQVLQNYQEDFERYYETKDELLLYNNGGVIAYRCQFCSSKDHRTEDCFDFELRRMISSTILHFKDSCNDRKYYPRRSFKVNLHEKHQKRRKNTLRHNEKAYDPRQSPRIQGFSSSLLHQKHHFFQDTPRKLSAQSQENKKHKAHIRNQKTRNENMRALERIRRQHHQDNLSVASDESQSVYNMKFEELNIDAVMEYKEYYPHSNVSELSVKQIQRRRITRMVFNANN